MPILVYSGLLLGCYLLGSLSFAYWAGRVNGVDLREHGSGNIGATNAGRTLGKQWFFIVFFADVAKGLLPVLLFTLYGPALIDWGSYSLLRDLLPISAGMAAVIGHSFTCFHGFKGGKAVATSLGVLLALIPAVAGLSFLCWVICWLLVAGIWKIKRSDAVGPSSIVAALACPIIYFNYHEQTLSMPALPTSILVSLICFLIVVRHRSNAKKFFATISGKTSGTTPDKTAEASNAEQ